MTWQAREAVVDTSVLLYLHSARKLELLPALFARVTVPSGVEAELRAGQAAGIDVPTPGLLAWANVSDPSQQAMVRVNARLGRGEREVMAVALEAPNAVAVLDDRAARTTAQLLGLTVTGTLGLLIRAKQLGVLGAVGPVIDEIVSHGFRIDDGTRAAVLKLAGETI